jgi:hypothetical protein
MVSKETSEMNVRGKKLESRVLRTSKGRMIMLSLHPSMEVLETTYK